MSDFPDKKNFSFGEFLVAFLGWLIIVFALFGVILISLGLYHKDAWQVSYGAAILMVLFILSKLGK